MGCVAHPLFPPGTRYDADDVAAYMAQHSARVPRGQLDVYTGYWIARQSIAEISALDGLSRPAVEKRILRLRRRVRLWVTRQRPGR